MPLTRDGRGSTGRWGRVAGGLLSASVLATVPLLALLAFGPLPLLRAADDPEVSAVLALDAPAAAVAEAQSPDKTYGVVVAEAQEETGEVAALTLESWENTVSSEDTPAAFFSLLPAGIQLNASVPNGPPTFYPPNGNIQTFTRFRAATRKERKNHPKRRFALIIIVIVNPGRPSPA